MENIFKFIIESRQAFIRLVDSLSEEELNQIPEGFNNNIIWNFGHIVVSTQILCYVRTGVWEDASRIKYLDAYKKDSKPSYPVGKAEIEDLKALAITSIEEIKALYDKGGFDNMQAYSTATFGSTMDNFAHVLVTTSGHDNLHYGYAIAQKRAIKK